jgi:1,4-dihydroxy-2-naphthoate octaprenyltransferase
MILGVVVPAVLIIISEIILRIRKTDISEYKQYQISADKKIELENVAETAEESAVENKQGLRMIAIGILVTGFIIGVLGIMAENGRITVIGTAAVLLIVGSRIYFKSRTSKK